MEQELAEMRRAARTRVKIPSRPRWLKNPARDLAERPELVAGLSVVELARESVREQAQRKLLAAVARRYAS